MRSKGAGRSPEILLVRRLMALLRTRGVDVACRWLRRTAIDPGPSFADRKMRLCQPSNTRFWADTQGPQMVQEAKEGLARERAAQGTAALSLPPIFGCTGWPDVVRTVSGRHRAAQTSELAAPGAHG